MCQSTWPWHTKTNIMETDEALGGVEPPFPTLKVGELAIIGFPFFHRACLGTIRPLGRTCRF